MLRRQVVRVSGTRPARATAMRVAGIQGRNWFSASTMAGPRGWGDAPCSAAASEPWAPETTPTRVHSPVTTATTRHVMLRSRADHRWKV